MQALPIWLVAGTIFGVLFVALVWIVAVCVVKFQQNYNDALVKASEVQGGIIQILQGGREASGIKADHESMLRRARKEQQNGDLRVPAAVAD
jgi:hypothetical protein